MKENTIFPCGTKKAAEILGKNLRTIQRHCAKLNFPRLGNSLSIIFSNLPLKIEIKLFI